MKNGMRKCNKPCPICPLVKEGKSVNGGQFSWSLRKDLTCDTTTIIYMMQCNLDKCQMRYIGESKRSLKHRIGEHKGYVRSKIMTKETGYHFNLPGHDLSQMKVTILEKV